MKAKSPKKSPKKKPVEKKEAPFALTLIVGGKTYTSSGLSMHETLLALPHPPKVIGKGTLTIRKGERTRERVLVMAQIKRLFYPLAQGVLAKQLETGL